MERLYYYNWSINEINKLQAKKEKTSILLHVCCGPCSTYPLIFLCQFFDVTIYFNNSNIYPEEEYNLRLQELKKYIAHLKRDYNYDIKIIVPTYNEEEYIKRLAPVAHLPEFSERCFLCYRLRMEEAYDYAEKNNYDYFTTVMTISSQKNAQKINEIGQELETRHLHCRYFYSDFKKKKGSDYGRELTNKYGLYRQSYCGCRYSYAEYLQRKEKY